MAEKKTKTATQYHFTVPPADTDVIKWIQQQDSLSISLRSIIKDAVKRDGFVDIFCKPVTNPGVSPGRPSKVETQAPVQTQPQVVEYQEEKKPAPVDFGGGDMSEALQSMM